MVSLCIICIGISSGCAALCLCRLIYSFTVAFFTLPAFPYEIFLVRFMELFSMFLKATTTTYINEANECYGGEKKVMNIFDFIVYNGWNPFFMVHEVEQWNINGFVHVCGIIVLVYQSLYINCPKTFSLHSASTIERKKNQINPPFFAWVNQFCVNTRKDCFANWLNT